MPYDPAVQGAMPRGAAFTQALCADAQGFSLHGALRCAGEERQRLEQLCRYIWPMSGCSATAQQRQAGRAQAEDALARRHHPHRDVAAGVHAAAASWPYVEGTRAAGARNPRPGGRFEHRKEGPVPLGLGRKGPGPQAALEEDPRPRTTRRRPVPMREASTMADGYPSLRPSPPPPYMPWICGSSGHGRSSPTNQPPMLVHSARMKLVLSTNLHGLTGMRDPAP